MFTAPILKIVIEFRLFVQWCTLPTQMLSTQLTESTTFVLVKYTTQTQVKNTTSEKATANHQLPWKNHFVVLQI